MKKKLLTSLILFSIYATTYSQNKTEDFNITIPAEKVKTSLYNSIELIDGRYDTSNLGVVQIGAFNRKVKVIPQIHLSVQLAQVLKALTDDKAGNGKLLMHLRHFNFAEITGATKERGYFHIKADLYAYVEDRYSILNRIDTVVVIKSLDVTKPMFRRGSQILVDLIASSLDLSSSPSTGFTYNEVMQMDDIDKRSLAVYSSPKFAEGIYKSYESFKKQEPDGAAEIAFKMDKVNSVKLINRDGTLSKIKAGDIYALVQNNLAYVATEFGYYPLRKVNNDLMFTGKAKVTANTGDVIAASVFFGLIGGLIASEANAIFEMKIDHANGGFIRLREVSPSN